MSLSTEQIVGIVTVVVGFTELVKLSKYVPDRFGLLIAAVFSALGEFLFIYSQPEFAFTRTMIWSMVSAYLVIITAAAGVYGIIRSTTGAQVTDASGPRNTPRAPMWIVGLLGSALILSGCAKSNPNMSPERQVALYAIQATKVLSAVKTTADGLYADQTINQQQYTAVLEALKKVNEQGIVLTDALKAYDAALTAVEKDALVPKVNAALIAFNTLLPGVLNSLTNSTAREKISAGITDVQNIVLTIARLTAPQKVGRLSTLTLVHV